MARPLIRLLSAVRSRTRLGARVVPLLVALATGARLPAQAAPARDPSPHSDVVLVSDRTTAAPGQPFTVALRLTLDPGWHTYWTNPGDAGLPVRATWTLPAGVTAGPLRFPTPRLAPQPPLMSYGYEREVLVLVDLNIPATATPGTTLRITGTANWLACADVCLPATGPLSLDVPVAAGAGAATRWAPAIAATRSALPASADGWRLQGFATDSVYVLVAVAPRTLGTPFVAPYVFVDSAGIVDHAAPQRIARNGDTLIIAIPRARSAAVTASALRGIISPDANADTLQSWQFSTALRTPLPAMRTRALASLARGGGITTGGVSAAAVSATGATDAEAAAIPGTDMTVLVAVAFAFLGGLLLNLMPCVFPVLSVKVLALLEHGGGANVTRSRNHGLVFAAGVLLSFWLLAGVLMALRAGGESLGWGFQLQSPPVVALLALLLFALGLNLSGVFDIGLSLTRLGGAGGGRSYADSLLTGGLAVLVAAPCTAPFMGAALGFALVQPPAVGFLVFTALGAGLALPFVILTSVPQLLRFLPRPGPWLETLKQLFAFPLYATVVWLLWVFGQQAGVDALAIVLMAMIVLALGAWLWARGVRSAAMSTRITAGLLMFAAVAVSVIGAQRAKAPATVAAAPAGWEPWSEARVSALRAEGRPVFVDFTAAWCLSCQVNERVALNTTAVQAAFASANVALLRADWTSQDAAITKALSSFGRSGVPLYVLYPSGRGTAAILPAVLSPGMVIAAVRKAAPTAVASGLRVR